MRDSDKSIANRFIRECREVLSTFDRYAPGALYPKSRSESLNDAEHNGRTLHRLLLRLIFARFRANLESTDSETDRHRTDEWIVAECCPKKMAAADAAIPPDVVDALERMLDRFPFDPAESPAQRESFESLEPCLLGRVVEELSPGRHESGAYYTPRPVVAFICREALKEWLGPGSEGFVESGDASMVERPQEVLQKLRCLRICDPACGSGAFLIGMFQELWALRQSLFIHLGLDPAENDPREILCQNLYGMDQDPLAVESARMRLSLAAANADGGRTTKDEGQGTEVRGALRPSCISHPSSFVLPESSIRVCDTLLRSPPYGSFDMVLMNPPYLSRNRAASGGRPAEADRDRALKQRYGFAGDLYVYFLALGLDLLNETGVLYAITPASYLTNITKEPIRRRLLASGLQMIAPLGPELFPAVVYPCITGVAKRTSGDAIRYLPLRELRLVDFIHREFPVPRRVSHAEYEQSFRTIFYEPLPESRRLFGALLCAASAECDGRFAPLKNIAPALDTGIDSGNVRQRLFFRSPGDRRLPRLIQGVQVVRYGCWWENPAARYYYVDTDYQPDPAAPGIGRGGKPSARPEYWSFRGPAENHRAPERILLRQTADEPFAGFIRQGSDPIYTDNTIHTLILTEEGRHRGVTYPYLLGILNSRTFRSMYRQVSQEEGRILAQVKTTIINRLPIPIPSPEERERIEESVRAIQENRVWESANVGEWEGQRSARGTTRAPYPVPRTGQDREKESAADRVRLLQAAIDEAVAELYAECRKALRSG